MRAASGRSSSAGSRPALGIVLHRRRTRTACPSAQYRARGFMFRGRLSKRACRTDKARGSHAFAIGFRQSGGIDKMSVGAAELWWAGYRFRWRAGPPATSGSRSPSRASRRSPRCSCSGAASARTASRSARSAFIVFLFVVALAAPLIVKLLGLPGPYVQNPNLTDSFGTPLGPEPRAPVRRRPARPGRDVPRDLRHARRAGGGDPRHGRGDADRRRDRHARGLLPRLGRHAALALDRRRAVDPDPAARPRVSARPAPSGAASAARSSRASAS